MKKYLLLFILLTPVLLCAKNINSSNYGIVGLEKGSSRILSLVNSPELKLDKNNITGAGGTNINVIACSKGTKLLGTSGGTLSLISPNGLIQSISIELDNIQDVNNENLGVGKIISGISIQGNGTNSIVISNKGTATLSDMEDVLNNLYYQNSSFTPNTTVQRRINVKFTDALGQMSNSAIIFLNVSKAVSAGNSPRPLMVNENQASVDLFAGLDGSENSGGVWEMEGVSGNLSSSIVSITSLPLGKTTYRYSVSGNSPCGSAFTNVVVIKMKAQEIPLTSGTACGFLVTNYSNSTFSADTDDPIYFVNQSSTNDGSLTSPEGANGTVYNWYKFDPTTNSYKDYAINAGSTINNLPSGGYLLVRDENGVLSEGRAWIWNIREEVKITELGTVCKDTQVSLQSTINPGSQSYTYYNPVRRPFTITANTKISVTFNANHTFVSDLGFYFINPTGNKIITLAPNAGQINGINNVCNSGDNVSGLTFTNDLTTNSFLNVCSMAAPLSGSYNGYYNNLINWSALYGEDANSGGWKVQVYDCISSDRGALTGVSVKFDDGAGNVVTYNSGNINSAINDNSCSPQTASIYVVPSNPAVQQSLTINLIDGIGVEESSAGYEWAYSTTSSTGPFVNFENSQVNPQLVLSERTWIKLKVNLGIASCKLEDAIEVNVQELPVLTVNAASFIVKSGNPTNIVLSSETAGTTYNWTVVQNGVTGASNGTGNSITQILTTASSGTATYTITPFANGCEGNPVEVIVKVNLLSVPSTPALIASDDTGISSTDNITKANNLTFTGTADPNVTIILYSGDLVIGSGLVNTNGEWEITTSTILAEGNHLITAVASDNDGNFSSPSTVLSINIDRTALQLSTVSISSNNVNSEFAKTGDIVTLTFTSSELIVNPTVNIAGQSIVAVANGNTWTAIYSVLSTDPDGAIPFSISFTDVAGNSGVVSSTTNESSVNIDLTPPAIPLNLLASINDAQVTLSWDANSESDIAEYHILFDTTPSPNPGSLIVVPAGTNTFTHTGLTNGTVYYYQIIAVDKAGNISSASVAISAVPKKFQTIIFNAITEKTYGDASFSLGEANSSAGFVVNYEAEDPTIVSISGNQATILKTGSTKITAKQAGNNEYGAAPDVEQILNVAKKTLTIRANAAERCYGAANPVLGMSYLGFKNGEDASQLTTLPTVGTTANTTSIAGNYVLVPSGAQSVNYIFDYINGTLTVNPLPVNTITSDKGTSINKGETAVLTVSSDNGTSYRWSSATGIISGLNSTELTVRPMETTTYTVTVTNANGCESTASFTVDVKGNYQAIEAENFITPNGDGINDVWVVKNINAYPDHTLTIFDRAGRILYKARDYQNDWGGP